MARICAKVPAQPADTVHEALMSIWISFVCLHVENANSALSIGRLDQMLQPLFLKDMSKAEERGGKGSRHQKNHGAGREPFFKGK